MGWSRRIGVELGGGFDRVRPSDHVPIHGKAGSADLGSGVGEADEGQARHVCFEKNEITRSVHLGLEN